MPIVYINRASQKAIRKLNNPFLLFIKHSYLASPLQLQRDVYFWPGVKSSSGSVELLMGILGNEQAGCVSARGNSPQTLGRWEN